MIALRAVTKRFGEQVVLDGLDLDLPPGWTALMGPNGSGKTTIARLVLGLTAPDAGEVVGVDGLRRAAVFQEDRLCDQLTAPGNVRLVLGRAGHSGTTVDPVATLRAAGLDDDALAKPARDLSGGQRRRVAIVRALVTGAELVVLDEPFKGLDVEARGRVMTLVRERCAGHTCLLVTHDVTEAQFFGAKVVALG